MLSQIKDVVSNGAEIAQKKINTLDKSTSWWALLIGYITLGFICGFLIKHIGKLLFWIIICCAVLLFILQYANLVIIQHDQIYKLLGLGSDVSLSDIFASSMYWIRTHIYECLAILGGMFLARELT